MDRRRYSRERTQSTQSIQGWYNGGPDRVNVCSENMD